MEGEITISRVSCSNGPDFIQIEIGDKMSHTQVTRITMSPEVFGTVVTGLGCQPCEFERPGRYVGKVHEHKAELVPTPAHYDDDDMIAEMESFEVDGWKAYRPDLFNMHRRIIKKPSKDTFQKVTFHRYVEPILITDLMP